MKTPNIITQIPIKKKRTYTVLPLAIEYESDIPVPAKKGIDKVALLKPLVVGSCFFVPAIAPRNLYSAFTRTAKNLGYQIICKSCLKNGVPGSRIWRKK